MGLTKTEEFTRACTHAVENCPVVEGASVRISLPFNDPKDFDDTNSESARCNVRSLEIGREILYAFFSNQ